MHTILSIILLSGALTGISAAPGTSENETQLLATLHQMYEAEQRHDIKLIRSHLSDDFAEIAGDGRVYYWKDIEPGVADMELRDYKLTECISNFFTPDSAYLSCKMEVDASFKGNALPRLFRVTWVWTRAKGQAWVMRFEQATIIPTPASHGEAGM